MKIKAKIVLSEPEVLNAIQKKVLEMFPEFTGCSFTIEVRGGKEYKATIDVKGESK